MLLKKVYILFICVNILSLFKNALTRESVQSGAGREVTEEREKKMMN